MVKLAGNLTGRINLSKIHIGYVYPNIVVASVVGNFSRRAMRRLGRRAPLGVLNVPSSVTRATIFLYDSETEFVAKRVINMGNKVVVWLAGDVGGQSKFSFQP